jgi:DNA-binding response OmpR family regulator
MGADAALKYSDSTPVAPSRDRVFALGRHEAGSVMDDVLAESRRRLLLLRVDDVLRRTEDARTRTATRTAERYQIGDVIVDVPRHTVRKGGRPVALRPREFDLLVSLARRGGRLATRAELLDEVWGYGPAVHTRTLDTHICMIRRKIEADPRRPRYLITVHKLGYRLRLE